MQEVTKWVNQHLGSVGHTDQLITDLSIDMADGITLLQLVQALCKLEHTNTSHKTSHDA